MRNRPVYLLFSILITWSALAQPLPTPTAPDQVPFADLTVRFDPDARRLVQQDINALMANRQYWNAKLDRALLYFPIVESVLLGEQIPTDFKFLAMQESSLMPDAVSSSQAVGFWQFKRETALDYGLQVNEQVDERKNITASTHATARYLRRSNNMYNNWVSALYSFYLGTGGISQIVSPDWANAKDITLDGRTDRYILRFFAHKIAAENAFKTYRPTTTFALIEYPNAGGKTIDGLAAELNLSPADIRTYNRWLLIDHVPTGKDYVLTLPTPNSQINELRQRIASTTNQPITSLAGDDLGFPVLRKMTVTVANADDPILYEINGLPGIQAQAGDNAGSLARKAKISLSSFLRFNELTERDLLVPGEVYYLSKKRKKALVPFHTARADESMRSISQRYGIRLKKLLKYNRMDRVQKLQVGRVLWLREKRPAKTPVEVVNSPIPPVYDPTPATPSNRPVAGRPVGSEQVPRTASERKKYQPKLIGSATPSAETPAPETATARNVPTTPSPRPTPTRPTPTVPPMAADVATTPPAETPAPRTSSSPQRTIIVRSDDEPVRERTTPARQLEPTRPTETAKTTKPAYSGNVPDEPVTPKRPTTYPETPDPTRGKTATLPPLPPMTRPKTETASTSGRTMTHTVDAGQTYYSISKFYGVTVDDLLLANDLTLDNKLAVGQKLVVRNVQPVYPTGQPVSPPVATMTTAPAETVAETPAPVATGPTYHTIAKGETLYSISRQYGVSVEQLVEWNKLPDLNARLGQKLKVSE